MSNKRIHQAAKELGLTSASLLQLLTKLGFEVKSHMSVFTEEMALKVQLKFEQDKEIARQEELKRQQTEQIIAESKYDVEESALLKRKKRKKKKRKRIGRNYAEEMRKLEEERRKKREELLKSITKEKVSDAVKKTLAMLSQTKRKKKYKKREEEEEESFQDPNVIKIYDFLTTQQVAERIGVSPIQLIEKCFKELGVMITLNQRLDFSTISLIAESYGKKVEKIEAEGEIFQDEEEESEDEDENLQPRPPVVTIMGHVDHGKTTLLDYIRQTNVVAGEVGGITQHIGAYQVETKYGKITFIDTPGHKAFTAMRARGSQVTDIVVLVIDWKDGVMPQTEEAISHARAAGVPIIVAINKMDMPGATSDKVLQQLSDLGILCDKWGGDTLCVEISAKNGENVELLIEYIILQAEALELKANPYKLARGTVLEAKLDRGRGPIATVLIQQGTLRKGDPIVAGTCAGKVRNIFDERDKPVEEAPPSTPVQIIGLNGVPQAGDTIMSVETDQLTAQIAEERQSIMRQQDIFSTPKVSLKDLYKQIEDEKIKSLKIILKADYRGSVEAISDVLSNLCSEEVRLEIIHKGVGPITENDVLLASASRAIIIGFNSKPDSRSLETALKNGVEIRTYRIIYELEDDIRKAIQGMLAPEIKEEILGKAKILQIFKIPQLGTVVGCMVEEGYVKQGAMVRISRNGETLGEGVITELRRFKDQVKEVVAGLECGMRIEGIKDFQPGDILSIFQRTEVCRTL